MNIMLVAVAVVSLIIGQVSTALLVGFLVLLNVVLGARQELAAQASVDALSKLQVPQTRLVRDGQLLLVPASEVVPGGLVQGEAGDIVPADGRIITSATLEAQEAALTGESAPVSKDSAVLAGPEVAVGDRSNMLSNDLQKPAAHSERARGLPTAHGERPCAEQRQEGRVVRPNTDLSVKRGSHDGVGIAVEQRPFRGNDRDPHDQPLARRSACAATSSIPPTM